MSSAVLVATHGETAQRRAWACAGADLTLGRLWLVPACVQAKPRRRRPAHQAQRRFAASEIGTSRLAEAAARQVVSAAEDILADAWIDELESFRTAVLDAAASVRTADRAAREHVREAQRHGGPHEIALAHQRLADAEDGRRIGLDEACRVLEALDNELEHVCLVGIERSRNAREDLARLRTAWAAAYGKTHNKRGSTAPEPGTDTR